MLILNDGRRILQIDDYIDRDKEIEISIGIGDDIPNLFYIDKEKAIEIIDHFNKVFNINPN